MKTNNPLSFFLKKENHKLTIFYKRIFYKQIMYTYPLPFNLCPCGEGKFLLHFVFNTHLTGQRRMKLGTEKYLAQHKPRIIQVFSGVAFYIF